MSEHNRLDQARDNTTDEVKEARRDRLCEDIVDRLNGLELAIAALSATTMAVAVIQL